MRPVVVVVGDVVADKSTQVALADHDDVVEQFSTNASHPALGDAVLPGTPPAGPRRLDAEGLHRRDDLRGEARVPIEDQMARPGVEGERLAELLDQPRRRGLPSDLEVQDPSSSMADHEPDIQGPERHRDREEVHGCDRVAVVAQEHKPARHGVGTGSTPRQARRPLWAKAASSCLRASFSKTRSACDRRAARKPPSSTGSRRGMPAEASSAVRERSTVLKGSSFWRARGGTRSGRCARCAGTGPLPREVAARPPALSACACVIPAAARGAGAPHPGHDGAAARAPR